MKNIFCSIKKQIQLSLSIILLFYSSFLLASNEVISVGFDNKTDKAIYYKFTIFGSSPMYGIIEPNRQSNMIEVGQMYPNFAFNYNFILGDIDSGVKLIDEGVSYSEEEGHRQYLLYIHPDYEFKFHFDNTSYSKIIYEINRK